MSTADIFSALDAKCPLNSSWVRIAPNGTSHKHQHHDTETWFVAAGSGILTLDTGGRVEAERLNAGDAVIFPPFSAHQIQNTSDTDTLLFLTVHWEDFEAAINGAAAQQTPSRKPRAIVTAAPPTTNGDLHLGHLSGPYLGADTLARYLRLRGVDAHFCCGSDDYQSYVEALGHRTGRSPDDVSSEFSLAVHATLSAVGAVPAVYIRSGVRLDHQQRVRSALKRLVDGGFASAKTTDCLFCPVTGQYLYEPYLSGSCPNCGVIGRGNSCEECGLPHDPIDMVDAVSTVSGAAPVRRPLTRIVFSLEPFRDQIATLVSNASLPDRLRIIGEQLLERPLPDIALTHQTAFGVEVGIDGFEDQRIWAWFDMWVNYYSQLHELSEVAGWPHFADLSGVPDDVELVQFFGCDNGWYHIALYPMFAFALFGQIPDVNVVTNEFLLLEGRKFSTSQKHAIWGREALADWPEDIVRMYLAHVRPETAKRNFERADLATFVANELVGQWQRWIDYVGERVNRLFDGQAPVAGLWTGAQMDFLADIEAMRRDVASAYEYRRFSPATVSRRLIEFVRRARSFSDGDARWDSSRGAHSIQRAGVALELAALQALSLAAAPIMPTFAARVWKDLGHSQAPSLGAWNRIVPFLAGGTPVCLSSDYFLRSDH